MTALDDLPEEVMGLVQTEVNSIPGDTESTPSWVYALNRSKVSTICTLGNSVVEVN
jgi:hypothetical protein